MGFFEVGMHGRFVPLSNISCHFSSIKRSSKRKIEEIEERDEGKGGDPSMSIELVDDERQAISIETVEKEEIFLSEMSLYCALPCVRQDHKSKIIK